MVNQAKFKIINCPLCNGGKYKILYSSTLTAKDHNFEELKNNLKNTMDNYKKHGRIVRCLKCNLVYVNPTENLKNFLNAYKQVVDPEYLATEKYRKILMYKHLNIIKMFKRRGTLLDIGCFTGSFPEIVQKEGFLPYGIEPSRWAVRIAKARKIKIIGENLEDTLLPFEKFDVISLWDVIEHLPNPNKIIKKLKKTLKEDGILAIGTPNIESLIAKIFKGKHPYLIRMHIVLFGPKTIKRLLENNGFSIIYLGSYGRTYPLYYYLDRLSISFSFLKKVSQWIREYKTISNFPVTINLRDEMLIIAKKER
jgi:2-polyprenyl-3-methyl-5-hydroxy-6-metoxy-1,4-benzoquinol methylase